MKLIKEERRSSNLELLRIIAMVLITFNHIVSLGNSIDETNLFNTLISLFFLLGGKFATNLFIILALWFSVDKKLQFKKIIEIWMQTLFYSQFLNILDILLLKQNIAKNEIIRGFFRF